MAERTCPMCERPLPRPAPHAPFCSGRCRDVDLGAWLQEGYRLSRPMTGWELESAYGEAMEEAAEAQEDEER